MEVLRRMITLSRSLRTTPAISYKAIRSASSLQSLKINNNDKTNGSNANVMAAIALASATAVAWKFFDDNSRCVNTILIDNLPISKFDS